MKSNRRYYPLTAAQRMLLYSQKWTLHKQVNNIFTLLLLERELDFAVLKQAIELTYEHMDSLRLRFARIKGEIQQFFMARETPAIRVLDFTGKTQEQMDRVLYKLAAIPLLVVGRPMSKVYLVRDGRGKSGVYLGVNHMVLDSWGICIMMKYVIDVYEALKNKTEMPKPPYPHEPLLVRDNGYRDTPQYQRDLAFWQEEFTREEPWYTHINGTRVLENYRRQRKNPNSHGATGATLRTRARHEVVLVSAENMKVMEGYCLEHKLPMQILFMMGVRTVLSVLNERQKDVSFYGTCARRGTLQEKTSGGTRVHSFMFRTILEEDCTFADALEQLRSRQSLLYRHADFDLLDIIKLMQDTYFKGDPLPSHLSVCLTFQPVPLTMSSGERCHTKWYSNGCASQPFYLTIMDDDGSGALRCYYEYQKAIITRQRILEFHDIMVRSIMAGLENPGVTVGELLDLDIAQAAAQTDEKTA